MTRRFCLRCDWHGETTDTTCADCGAPLYRRGAPRDERRASRPPAAQVRDERASDRGDPETRVADPGSSDPIDLPARSRSAVTVIGAVVVLLLILNAVVNGDPHARRTAVAGVPPRLSGTLVYAVPDGRAWSRLWRWDLATGHVVRGPRVLEAIGLLSVPGANVHWVGVTSELASGRLQASVLRSLGPKDRATRIVSGDLVVWDASGRSVAAANSVALDDGCRRHVSITWAKLVPAIREPRYDDPSLCGDVLSLGVDDSATYFTLLRNGNAGIYLAGVHRIHPILPGHALVSMSAVSDMVVVPESSLPGSSPLPIRPELQHDDLPLAGLFFRGEGAHLLTGYGIGEDRLAIDAVLAWSSDGLHALVDGLLGRKRGLFEIGAGPTTGVRVPTYLGRVEGVAYATYTSDGTPLVVTSEGVFAVVDHALTKLSPPTDAPPPDGPIVWLR